MKTSLITLASLSFFMMIASCKKENATTNNNPSNSSTKLVRIQEGTDPDLNNDSVYLFKYDDSSRLTGIVDSLNQYTTTVTSNSQGNPLTVNDGFGQTASFTYDANGVLTQLDYMMAGSHEQDVFEYSGGVLSKRTHNTNLGSGPLKLSETFTYIFTGGNITSMSEFDLNGTLVQTTTLTYGNTPNNLKLLGLLNYGNLRGAQTIANLETYFNKNLLTGYTQNSLTNTNTYTLNTSQQPVHIVTNDNIEGGVYTWYFSYQ
jgi:hypothetical protein